MNYRYIMYLVMKYFPLAISGWCGGLLFYYGMLEETASKEDLKYVLLTSLFSSTFGWALLFMAEESLRKLMLASHSLVDSINKIMEESKDEDSNKV